MRLRKIPAILLLAVFLAALLVLLSVLTERLRSRKAVSDMNKALALVLEEKGEKGLLELAGADSDRLFYEYEGVSAYTGQRPAWDYSQSERRNMAIYASVSPSVVQIESFKGLSRAGEGAGVVYSSDGYILTNKHVIGDGETFLASFPDGSSSEAFLKGSDSISDVAVLKVERTGLAPVKAGSSEDTAVGEEVYAIGHPFGYSWSFSKGLLTGKERMVIPPEGPAIPGMLQTDASINPGNSGGPLLSSSGLMVGLVSSIYSPTGYSQGVAFALPAETVFSVADDIINTGSAHHGWLDLIAVELNSAIAGYASLPVSEGILVSQTVPAGEADRGGLKGGSRRVQYGNSVIYLGGDILTGINGSAVRSFDDYTAMLFKLKAGDKVDLTVLRGNREVTLKGVTLVEQTEENSRWLVQ